MAATKVYSVITFGSLEQRALVEQADHIVQVRISTAATSVDKALEAFAAAGFRMTKGSYSLYGNTMPVRGSMNGKQDLALANPGRVVITGLNDYNSTGVLVPVKEGS